LNNTTFTDKGTETPTSSPTALSSATVQHNYTPECDIDMESSSPNLAGDDHQAGAGEDNVDVLKVRAIYVVWNIYIFYILLGLPS
jgi:hypothetical protein